MGIAQEAVNAKGPLAATLAAGVNTLSGNQTITFQPYTRFVMSQDGFVFWVKSGVTFDVKGSLHQIADQNQKEDETIAINRMIFTSEQEVSEFNEIGSQTLFVGAWDVDGVTLKVVFNSSGQVYKQAGLWHYTGDAVYPALESQLVNSESDLPQGPIVSNSIGIWLGLNEFAPVYSSYLLPSNIRPPYMAVHIGPEDTTPLQQFANDVWPGTQTGPNQYLVGSTQLMRDEVRITLYGFNAQQVGQYLAYLRQNSIETDQFGFCNSPAITDGKRKQSEIGALAQQKIIKISTSYYQNVSDANARRLILAATVSYQT